MPDFHDTAEGVALRAQIDDLRDALKSILAGGVDTVIMGGPGAEQVYSLTSADRPYRLIIEEMTEGALTVSDRGVVLYANTMMTDLLGRQPGSLVGSDSADMVVPDDRGAFAALLGLIPGQHDRTEVTLLGAHERVPVLAAASCLDLDETRVHCFVVTDLRAQKAVESRLRASEGRLRQFLDSVPVGLRIADKNMVSHYINAEARRVLAQVGLGGHDVSTVEAAFVEAGTSAQIHPALLPLALALEGETTHSDALDLRGPEGVSVGVELWGTPIRDDAGQVEFGILAMADVSRRRQDQQVIDQQAALLDLAHDAVMVWDEESGIQYWNHGAELTYGYSRAEALGTKVSDLLRSTLPEPDDRIHLALAVDGQWEGEVEQVDASGKAMVVTSRWAPHLGRDGSRKGVLQVDRDVTARKAAEVALADRAAAVEAANAELNRSNEDLEQFAYAASHDLAEPLRAISQPITLLSRRYAGQLDDDADTYIGFIVDGCARMQQLIDSLLVYSRVGRMESGQRPVDLSLVLADVVGLLGRTIDERGAVVTWGPLPTVTAEPSQLIQVFQNLLANALKFVPADTSPVVTVSAERRGAVWRFVVDDNGIGIDPRHRERVFGMFKRLHAHDEYPGTGIGLALVKRIVERHHGDVGVEDAPAGTGCRFWFTLPAGRPADAAPA